MRIISKTIILLLVVLTSCVDKKHDKRDVSIVFPITIDAFKELEREFNNTLKDSFNIKVLSAEGDPSKFESNIQSALIDSPKYLVTIGTQITNTAFGPKYVERHNIVLAGAISSPELVESLVKRSLEPPRKSQLAIISDSPKEDIYRLLANTTSAIFPEVETIGVIFNPSEINSVGTSKKSISAFQSKGIKVIEGNISSLEDVDKILEKLLLQGVQAVLIPHDKYAVTKASYIVKRCNELKVPVISLDDGTVKRDGVVLGISVNYGRVGKMIAEAILEIEFDEIQASNIPIKYEERASIYINRKSAKYLQINVPKELNVIEY